MGLQSVPVVRGNGPAEHTADGNIAGTGEKDTACVPGPGHQREWVAASVPGQRGLPSNRDGGFLSPVDYRPWPAVFAAADVGTEGNPKEAPCSVFGVTARPGARAWLAWLLSLWALHSSAPQMTPVAMDPSAVPTSGVSLAAAFDEDSGGPFEGLTLREADGEIELSSDTPTTLARSSTVPLPSPD
ncbi:hypothetical protein G7Z17_g7839 [Cylindrodendrum hubeiense]|uniref:Uncharacterized protein n=1 Tax=Cylindrodendrum hubeiense TaxID=595255 RepID=A0A9P5LDT1_9HYPO|nr:hypothetical protein G7Z17_g7839 [Cylindrodendrum hubeiense]